MVTAQAIENGSDTRPSRLHEFIGEQFGRAEDVVYIVLEFLLACTAGALLVAHFQEAMIELALLTLMVITLVVSLRLLQTRKKDAK